jgi:hypothetical protein
MNDVSASNPADIPISPPKRTVRDIIYAEAAVGLGLGLSAVWTIFLGYEFTRLIALAGSLVY